MHDINFSHHHELEEGDFSGCCKDCQSSVAIIKPHIIGFAERIKTYTPQMLADLKPNELYALYQILDDLAHLDTGDHLAQLIFKEPDISRVLPIIRSYYTLFFSVHEATLAKELLESENPWKTLESFPLYPRYETLVKSMIKAVPVTPESRFAFIGCGPVPMSLLLMSRLYGLKSIGLDNSSEAVALSQKVIAHLGVERDIRIICDDETRLEKFDWDMVLVAALAEPKAKIFKNLHRILKADNGHRPVIFRTYTGMREVLYEPVKSEDIGGFRITQRILPTGRVNNTTVFAELAN
jgi:hypothetical protein